MNRHKRLIWVIFLLWGISACMPGLEEEATARNEVSALNMEAVLNRPVVTQDGERVGTVADFVIDPETDQFQYALVSMQYGDFYGKGRLALGARPYIAIPWELVDIDADEAQVIVHASMDTLQFAPEVEKGSLTLDQESALDQYWAQTLREIE